MKVLYHHRTRATDAQGVHILAMVRAFRSLGHEVIMASLVNPEDPQAPAPSNSRAQGTSRKRIPYLPELVQIAYNVLALPWLLWRIWAGNPAFIYERYSLFNFAGVVAARLCGKPLVLEVNSPLALEHLREGAIRASNLAHWSEKTICNLATHVIAVTNPLRSILISGGVKSEKITVMANGVDLAHFASAVPSRGLRSRFGLEGMTVFGFVGWFRPWHGLDLLIDSFAEAELAQQGCRLLLVGDGPAAPDLRNQVTRLGLQHAVLFTGPVRHEEIPFFLRLFDVAVQPACNEYCCPMKILEYMGLALPIVAPRQENIRDLLVEEVEGLFFQPGSRQALMAALRTLAQDARLRSRLGQSARQAIRNRGYLWTDNAGRVLGMVSGSSARTAAAVHQTS